MRTSEFSDISELTFSASIFSQPGYLAFNKFGDYESFCPEMNIGCSLQRWQLSEC
jgi:hypothetical protein